MEYIKCATKLQNISNERDRESHKEDDDDDEEKSNIVQAHTKIRKRHVQKIETKEWKKATQRTEEKEEEPHTSRRISFYVYIRRKSFKKKKQTRMHTLTTYILHKAQGRFITCWDPWMHFWRDEDENDKQNTIQCTTTTTTTAAIRASIHTRNLFEWSTRT